jgi:hypothetical protein
MTARSLFKFAVTLALAIAMAGAYGVFSDAKASADSAASALGNNNSPATLTPATVLKKTRFAFGDSGANLPVGTFVLIDGTTLTCPGTSGTCTYSGSNWLQIDANATSNWTLLTAVDGTFIGVGGPFLGPVGTDFSANSWTDARSGFPFGSHTIQTFAYMRDSTATARNYTFEYKVFKP